MANILQDCVSILGKSWKETGFPVLLFGTTSEPEKIPQGVLNCFKHEVQFEVSRSVYALYKLDGFFLVPKRNGPTQDSKHLIEAIHMYTRCQR